MSLTYTTLKSQIALYLKRNDLTSLIPSFITMGENELNRRLNVLQRELRGQKTLTSGARTIAITDVTVLSGLTIKLLWRSALSASNPDAGTPTRLVYKTTEQLLPLMQDASGPPNFYTIEGGVNPTGDAAYTVRVDRPADQTYQLGTVESYIFWLEAYGTNWISERHEEAYLYASLVQAEPFIKNDKRIIIWRTMLEAVIDQIMEADRYARGAQNTTLVSEAARDLGAGNRYSIYES